jgi:zinc-binding alcohol dehydrogenase family protein
MPTSITAPAAAAMPLTTLTAYEMLFERLDINKPVPGGSETLLIIGGAGGVGSIAIQLARCLSDVTIIATASRPETKAWAKELGADYVIDHSKELAPQMLELGFSNVDFVYSTTHSQMYAEEVVSMMTPQGRYGLIDGPDVFDVIPFKSKAISIHWEFMFTRPMFETADMQRQGEILNEVAALIDAGTIKSTVTNNLGRINAVNLLEAHRLLESGSTRGKIVLAKF